MRSSVAQVELGQLVQQSPARRLLGVEDVAKLLGISTRSVARHADAGLIPQGVKLGNARKWDLKILEDWIAAGCKPVRRGR